ncbi:MAG TPA: glycosyltransferase family A protein [Bryobacteraceae bacterium]|nr:glycosyltransferase family A protein [Bryobacteraceae bacterium]
MKIAFLNQWQNAAENQAFESLRIAGARIGHELIHCANSGEVEACAPDFVLAPASTRAKLNDFPQYGVIHDPRDSYVHAREFFNNLRTHDGWFAISDTMVRFARNVAFSIGRDPEIGFFYNTCQRQSQSVDLETLLRERRLSIAYFGTNWDKRRSRLFRVLSREPGIVICGPQEAWTEIDRKSYGGELAFDGESVQARYAQSGIGLCVLSDNHLRDDVISNRVFEISSVGALTIACDTPWLRKYFGDSLYYFDQRLPDQLLLREILAARDRMYADPVAAVQRAAHARHVFESKFSGELLLANAVDHHCRITQQRAENVARAKERYWPLISIVTRCGTRPVEVLRRAVESLARQTYGRFHLILVRHHDLDLSPIADATWPNIERIQIVDCPGGNCSKSLWAGLNAVEGDYFGVLDDDDWVFSTHFEQLFSPLPEERQTKFLAYSGSLAAGKEPREILGSGQDTRYVVRYGVQSDVLEHIAGAISTNGFVASRDLLHKGLLADPEMDTAEDSYLALALFAQTTARFSYAATSVNEVGGADRISATAHPRRFEDCFTLQTRLSGRFRPPGAQRDAWAALRDEWETRPSGVSGARAEDGSRKVYRDSTFYLSTPSESELRCAAEGWHIRGSSVAEGCGKLGMFRRELALRTLSTPWVYAAELRFKRPRMQESEFLLRVELVLKSGRIGLGLLSPSGQNFLFRLPLRAMDEIQVVNIPVEDLSRAGLLIVQTWDEPAPAEVTIKRVQLMAAREG